MKRAVMAAILGFEYFDGQARCVAFYEDPTIVGRNGERVCAGSHSDITFPARQTIPLESDRSASVQCADIFLPSGEDDLLAGKKRGALFCPDDLGRKHGTDDGFRN